MTSPVTASPRRRWSLAPYAKAVTAGLTSLAGGVQLVYAGDGFQERETVTLGLAVLVAVWGTYAVPNADRSAAPAPATGPPPVEDLLVVAAELERRAAALREGARRA